MSELNETINYDLTYYFNGKNIPTESFHNVFSFLKKIRDVNITLEKVKKGRNKYKSDLNKIKKGRNKNEKVHYKIRKVLQSKKQRNRIF